MSQYDFGDLESPLSGTALINTHLEPWRNALHSNHSGNSRPSYAAAGMIWVETDTTPWNVWMFDGSDDVALGTLDDTNNLFTPSGSLIYNWCGTSGGTANAQTFTPARPITAYATGQAFEGVINTPNTAAAPTINISNIGAKTVKIYGPGGKVNLPVGALQGICRFVYDGTDLILLNVRPYNKSASIATASTVNLDNATGDFLHLTGTTTVNAFTLAEGQAKVCVADGIFTITDGTGSSPQGTICPGTANITTAANDVFIIRGEGSGTTRIVSYMRADGTPLVSAGGGGWVSIQEQIVPSAVSSVDFTTGIDSTYKAYAFVISNLKPSADQPLNLRMSSNGGSSYDSGSGNYIFAFSAFTSGDTNPYGHKSTSATEINISQNAAVESAAASCGANIVVYLWNPADAAKYTAISAYGFTDRDTAVGIMDGGGRRQAASAVNAIRFYFDGTNVASGTITLYGLAGA